MKIYKNHIPTMHGHKWKLMNVYLNLIITLNYGNFSKKFRTFLTDSQVSAVSNGQKYIRTFIIFTASTKKYKKLKIINSNIFLKN